MKLSICMMVKNEEPNLKRCLESIQPLMNTIETELIIVDTGSTDNTVEIAKKYTEHVYYKEWFDDFSGMRNHTISFATGDWILILDADEEMIGSEKLGALLPKIKNPDIKIVSMYVHSVINDDVDLIAPANSARVFRKGNIQYKGIVHNMPITSGDVYPSDIKLLHYGYLATDEELIKRKVNRTVTLLLKALEDEPNSEYYHFQLSQSYVMGKDVENAYLSAKKAYDLLNGKCSKAYIYIYAQYIKTLKMKSMFVELIRVSEEIFNVDDTHPDILFDYGMALLMMKRPEKSIQFLKRYLYVLDHKEDFEIFLDLSLTFGTTNDGNRDQAMYGIASAYLDMNDFEKSIAYFKQTIKDENLNYFIFTFAEATLDAPWTAHYFFELRNLIYDDLLEDKKRLIDNYIENAYRNKFNSSLDRFDEIIPYLNDRRLYDLVLLKRLGEIDQVKNVDLNKILTLDNESFRSYYGELIYKNELYLEMYTLINVENKKIFYNYIASTYADGLEWIWDVEKSYIKEDASLVSYFDDRVCTLDCAVYGKIIKELLSEKKLNFLHVDDFSKDMLDSIMKHTISGESFNQNLKEWIKVLQLREDSLKEIFLKNKILYALIISIYEMVDIELSNDLFKRVLDNFSIEAMYKYNTEHFLTLIEVIEEPSEILKLKMLEYGMLETFEEKGKFLIGLADRLPQISFLLIPVMESIINEKQNQEIVLLNNEMKKLLNAQQYEEMTSLYRLMREEYKYDSYTIELMAQAFSDVGDEEMAKELRDEIELLSQQ